MDPFSRSFPNYNTRTSDSDSVADHMQNLNLNRPTMPNSQGFPTQGPMPSGPPSQFAQPSPFMSRPPPPGYLPPSVGGGGPAQPPQSASGPPPMGMMSNGPPPGGAPRFMPPGSAPSFGASPETMAPPSFSSAQPPRSAPLASGPPPMGMMRNGPPPSGAPHFMPPGALLASPGTMAPPRMGSSFGGSGVSSPAGSPFSISGQGTMPPPPGGSSFGSPTWPMPQGQMAPPPMGPGAPQPPRMYGMPPPPLGNPSMASIGPHGAPSTGSSKIDPTQIPRPLPISGQQFNSSPPATNDYMARDTANCSPRHMRCTINQIPCTSDLLTTAGMPLALLVQPLALTHPSEEPIQIVDFGESGPVRCSRCKGYVNPFMKFIDQGRRFICNLCGFTDETPREYVCNLGPDGRRRDAYERPELCRGTVEFIATKEYMVRDPMPAVYFFLVDVSMNAVQTGATAAACSAISQVISDLPEGPRTIVGMATFDSTIHFYNLKRALQQPLMLIVPDVQDVYTPLQTDVLVPLSECREHLEVLLETIPTMFQSSKTVESAFGAAAMAAFLAMKSTGGKLMIFQSVLPSAGIGALSAREAEGRANISTGEKEPHKLLQPADKTYKTMAIDFAEYQVCVDVFVTTQSYVDIASISVIPRTTGGQVYYYYPFSVVSDPAKLYNDLRWNITRPQGFEAVMRVRCSQGIQVQEYSGNYCKRIPTDVDLPGIDCDKSILVTLKHDDKLQDGSECSFQCALLYTTLFGQRRIRVTTLSLPCTNMLSSLFRSADLDSQFTCFLKQAANEITIHPLSQVKEQVTNLCINSLFAYRKFCATPSSSGQLILPEALKLMPLYTLALIKSIGLRADGRIDDRSFWINYVSSISTQLAIPLVYPRMIAIHNLDPKEDDESVIPPFIGLSSEHISENGIYLLENGEDCLIYVGSSVDPSILQQIFGFSSVDAVPTQFVLQQFDNALSKNLNNVMNEIRRQRCSYLRIKLCKKGEPSGMLFNSYIVEDQSQGAQSYVDFLIHVHRKIQIKMTA